MTEHNFQGQGLADIMAEVVRQDKKWGVQDHDDWVWLCILVEEIGEAAQAMMKVVEEKGEPRTVREEVVQVGAVVFQWLLCIDRRQPPSR